MLVCKSHYAAAKAVVGNDAFAIASRNAIHDEAKRCMSCKLAQGDSQSPTELGKVATYLRAVWREQASTPTSDTFAILELADAEAAHTSTLYSAGVTEESMLEAYNTVRASYTCDPTTATRKA